MDMYLKSGKRQLRPERSIRGSKQYAILLAVFFATTASIAQAGDIDFQDPPALTEQQVGDFSWSGLYVGANVGANLYRDRTVEVFTATGGPTNLEYPYKSKGTSFGINLGADYQFGNIVVGAAGDFDMARINGGFEDLPIGKGRDRIHWQATLRGRLGYAVDRVLIYGTGGLAAAQISNTYTFVPTNTSETFKDVKYGWTLGAGVDVAVTDNWIIGMEYRHVDFNAFQNDSVVAFPGLTGKQNPSSDSLRISLNYKF